MSKGQKSSIRFSLGETEDSDIEFVVTQIKGEKERGRNPVK